MLLTPMMVSGALAREVRLNLVLSEMEILEDYGEPAFLADYPLI